VKLLSFLETKMDIFISSTYYRVVQGFQYSDPIIVGVLIAMQCFKLNPMQTLSCCACALVGSGA